MYTLYLDESGKPSMKDFGLSLPHFSIAGVIVHDHASRFINERAKQIKFKYFNKTDVVFHIYDIIENKKDFEIFKNKIELKNEFMQDLKNFIMHANFKVIYIGINKEMYLEFNPQIKKLIEQNINIKKYEDSLVKKMFKNIFKVYLCYLKSKSKKDKICRGQITVEGASEPQDFLCFTTYHDILGGCDELKMSNNDVRKFLTSLSFVTKRNNSIEVELADMVAYFLNWEHRFRDQKTKRNAKINREISDIFKQKVFLNKNKTLDNMGWQDSI